MRRSRRAAAVTLSVLVGAGGLAACGGSSSATTSAATSSQSATQQRAVAALTQFAGCMRAHGVPVPDPNAQGQIAGSTQLEQQYRNTPQGQAAANACQSYLQRAVTQLTPANMAQFVHAQLLFARCLRAHGVNAPDPTPSGEIQLNAQAVNKSSPQFQRAAGACQHLTQRVPHVAIGG